MLQFREGKWLNEVEEEREENGRRGEGEDMKKSKSELS